MIKEYEGGIIHFLCGFDDEDSSDEPYLPSSNYDLDKVDITFFGKWHNGKYELCGRKKYKHPQMRQD